MQATSYRFKPAHLYIDQSSAGAPLVQTIRQHLSGVPETIVEDPSKVIQSFQSKKDPFTYGKQSLLLMPHKGKFIKPFPEGKGYLSCSYYILHLGMGCDLDCTYCILQSYLTNPLLTLFTNLDDIRAELDQFLDTQPHERFRIGTGELIDSLSMDHLTETSRWLIPYFASKDNAILELKTKTDNIDHLLDLTHRQRTIVSWSLNTAHVQRTEEFKTATIEERLQAAHRLQEADYRVGLHFDPLIYQKGWKEAYKKTIRMIFDYLRAESIAWISMGSLRFLPALKSIASERFPKSNILYGEFVPGLDGKQRYFKSLRREMYTYVTDQIRRFAPQTPIYLCMESPELWEDATKFRPKNTNDAKNYLDEACFTF